MSPVGSEQEMKGEIWTRNSDASDHGELHHGHEGHRDGIFLCSADGTEVLRTDARDLVAVLAGHSAQVFMLRRSKSR